MFPPEIWDEICYHCSVITTRAKPGKALVALALTSRSVHVHAIRRIWYQIPQLTPLLNCLPPDLWGRQSKPSKGVSKSPYGKRLLRKILPEDLERIEKYANAVQIYGMTKSQGVPWIPDPHAEVLRRLQSELASFGKSLLPNVRIAIIRYANLAEFLDLFTVKSLRGFRMKISGPLLNKLDLNGYPQLEEVYVESLYDEKDMIEALSRVLCTSTLSNLRTLKIGRVTWDALKHIGSLPRLRALHLDFTTEGEIIEFSSKSCTDGFSSLEKLRVRCRTDSDCVNLLGGLPPSLAIRSIKIAVENVAGSSPISNIISSIVTCCRHDSLEAITIGYEDRTERKSESDFTNQHIEPLLVFRNLRQLGVELPWAHRSPDTFTFDDSMIRRMAIAWPKLVKLNLLHLNGRPQHPMPTLIGLKDLVQNCPELYLLGMTFDADIIPEDFEELQPTNCKLKEIGAAFSSSSRHEPGRVAVVLRKIFPFLNKMGLWWMSVEWYGVQHLEVYHSRKGINFDDDQDSESDEDCYDDELIYL